MIICIVRLQKRGIDENTFQRYLQEPLFFFYETPLGISVLMGKQPSSLGIHKRLQVSLTFGAL